MYTDLIPQLRDSHMKRNCPLTSCSPWSVTYKSNKMRHHWRSEFASTSSKANPSLHDFYREYFGKAPKRRIVPVSPPKKLLQLEPPNLTATLKRSSDRMPKETIAIEYKAKAKAKERKWDYRFNVKFSKDNPKFPVPTREYFDSPKAIDAEKTMRRTSPTLKHRSNRRTKSKATTISWQVNSRDSSERWRTSSPVMCDVNSLRHPKMRQYFL